MISFGDGMKPKITAVSYSRIKTYETCPAQAKYKFIDRIKEPGNMYTERGSELHKMCEDVMHRRVDTIPEPLQPVAENLLAMRDHCNAFMETELQLALDKNWEPCSWFGPQTFMRVVYDLIGKNADSPQEMLIVDHKSGKVYPEHEDQMTLYALAGFHLYPDVEEVGISFNYIDQGYATNPSQFARSQLDELHEHWDPRIERVVSDDVFAPNPSPKNCKWCFFSSKKNGPCPHG